MFRRSQGSLAALGFIGLGQMGARMAPNAFKIPDNTELFIFDVNEESMKQVKDACGADAKVTFCANPAEVAKNSKRIVTMLPNGNIVKNVFEGENGLLGAMQEGTFITDSSTIDTESPKYLSELVRSKKSVFCDAPVSGGINAAAAGTLTFMVGAQEAGEFETAKAQLAPFSKNTVHCGPVGAGQVVKICNNLILGQTMLAVSEAMLLGTRLGVDSKTLAGCINTSTGTCWSSNLYNPFPGVVENVPSSRNYEGGFGAALMLKDLKLAMDAANTAKLPTPGGQNATATYEKMSSEAGMGGLDFSGILKFLDEQKK